MTQKGMWHDASSTRTRSSRDSNCSTATPRGKGASVVTPRRTPARSGPGSRKADGIRGDAYEKSILKVGGSCGGGLLASGPGVEDLGSVLRSDRNYP